MTTLLPTDRRVLRLLARGLRLYEISTSGLPLLDWGPDFVVGPRGFCLDSTRVSGPMLARFKQAGYVEAVCCESFGAGVDVTYCITDAGRLACGQGASR